MLHRRGAYRLSAMQKIRYVMFLSCWTHGRVGQGRAAHGSLLSPYRRSVCKTPVQLRAVPGHLLPAMMRGFWELEHGNSNEWSACFRGLASGAPSLAQQVRSLALDAGAQPAHSLPDCERFMKGWVDALMVARTRTVRKRLHLG